MTRMRCGTPTWIAARPMPGAAYIVSNMSATSARTSSSTVSTSLEISRRRGSGTSTIGRMAMRGDLVARDCCFKQEAGAQIWAFAETLGGSRNRPSRPECLGKRAFIEIVEFATDGKSVRQLTETNWKSFKALGKVMGRGLALQRRVHG